MICNLLNDGKTLSHIHLPYLYTDHLGEPSKKKLRNFGHVAKRGGVSSSGKLFNEEKFGHVFRGGGSKGLVQSSFCKKKVCIEAP